MMVLFVQILWFAGFTSIYLWAFNELFPELDWRAFVRLLAMVVAMDAMWYPVKDWLS